MNSIRALLFTSLTSVSILSAENIYQKELKAFETSEKYKVVFSEDAPLGLPSINRDIENYKALTPVQRMLRFIFFFFQPIVVNAQTMPVLYDYIDGLCKKNNIETPTVFICTGKGFFNAAASKMFMSSGAIIIGREIINETDSVELEAIVAHEIGHIKHNHVNKSLAIMFASYFAVKLLKDYFSKPKFFRTQAQANLHSITDGYMTAWWSTVLTAFIINKSFEKEADLFACEHGKAQGIADFFTLWQEKDHNQDVQFDQTSDLLVEAKNEIGFTDRIQLNARYYLSKSVHGLNKAMRWIYHYTPYGAHPAPEKRVEAALEYLKTHDQNLNSLKEVIEDDQQAVSIIDADNVYAVKLCSDKI